MARKKKVPAKEYSEKTRRHASKYQGVYERHAVRPKIGEDTAYDIAYWIPSVDENSGKWKKTWEKVGWKSEGYSPELARDVRNNRIKAIRNEDDLPKQKVKAPTFKAVAEKYLKWSAETKNRGGIEDESRYKHHLKDRFDDKRLDEISTFDLERMKSDMVKSGAAPKSIAHCLGLLRAMFNKASEGSLEGISYQGPNPVKAKGFKMPVVQNQRDRFLAVDEADTLLAELKRDPRFKKERKDLEDPKLHDMALLSLYTGARAGEVFNLKGLDVNFDTGLIAYRDTKNTETRYIPMTDAVRDMLNRRMPADPGAHIFTDRNGEKIAEVSNAFNRVVDRLKWNDGIVDRRQRLVWHSLRHTFASWLAIQGTPILTISRLMGHKSISMAERYSHLSPDHKREAVMGLESTAIGKKKGKVVSIRKGKA
ncbi:MAG: tyrosine-type recombinase/integrase [Syntrophales bacterium]